MLKSHQPYQSNNFTLQAVVLNPQQIDYTVRCVCTSCLCEHFILEHLSVVPRALEPCPKSSTTMNCDLSNVIILVTVFSSLILCVLVYFHILYPSVLLILQKYNFVCCLVPSKAANAPLPLPGDLMSMG